VQGHRAGGAARRGPGAPRATLQSTSGAPSASSRVCSAPARRSRAHFPAARPPCASPAARPHGSDARGLRGPHSAARLGAPRCRAACTGPGQSCGRRVPAGISEVRDRPNRTLRAGACCARAQCPSWALSGQGPGEACGPSAALRDVGHGRPASDAAACCVRAQRSVPVSAKFGRAAPASERLRRRAVAGEIGLDMCCRTDHATACICARAQPLEPRMWKIRKVAYFGMLYADKLLAFLCTARCSQTHALPFSSGCPKLHGHSQILYRVISI